MNRKSLIATALGAIAFVLPAAAVDFEKEVLPTLENKCMGCHRAPYKTSSGRTKKPKGGLRMDNPTEMMKGGDSQEDGDKAIAAKSSAKSLVIARVTLDKDHDDFMPPQGEGKPKPLTDAELTAFKAWIDSGADFGAWKGTAFNDDGTKK